MRSTARPKLWQRSPLAFALRGTLCEHGRRPVDILKSADPKTLDLPKPIHIFGVSYMARAFLEILGHLSQGLRTSTSTPSIPVSRFGSRGWSRRPTKKGIRYERRHPSSDHARSTSWRIPIGLEGSTEMPALALWGRPGRENLRLLNSLDRLRAHLRIEDPTRNQDEADASPQIQHDICHTEPERETISNDFDFTEDESLVFLSCPGIRREIEIIAAEIWSLLKKDEAQTNRTTTSLSGSTTSPSSCRPAKPRPTKASSAPSSARCTRFPTTSSTSPSEAKAASPKPWSSCWPCPSASSPARIYSASPPTPSVMARFPEASPGDWLGWCDALGIVHGADHRDHEGHLH